MNIVSMLNKNAEKYQDKLCFCDNKSDYSYQTVLSMVKSAKDRLSVIGIQKGMQVIVLEPISVRLYIMMMALWSIGASVVVFDPSATDEYIEKCLSRISVDYFIGCKKAMLLRLKLKSIRNISHFYTIDKILKPMKNIGPHDDFIPVEMNSESPALITFTSGSTGVPKVAVRTHGFLLNQYEVVVSGMDYQDNDIDLAVLPVFTLVNMARGITTVIPNESLSDIAKVNAKRLTQQMQNTCVTRITTSPALIQRVADYAVKNQITLSHMRRLNIGGGPVFPFMLKNISTAFPNAALYLVYGSTEAEPIAEIKYDDISQEYFNKMQQGYGLIGGYIVDQIQCHIMKNQYPNTMNTLTEETFSSLLLEHEPGEIIVSGNHVLNGYLNGIGDEENKITVGNTRWHRTGDMGIFDENNCLWLLGRSSATIQDEQGTLYPFAVESAIYAKYQVKRCAVLQHNKKRILAVETTKEIAEKIELEKEMFQIQQVVPLKRIPLDIRHRSKIDYGKLKELLEKQK